jgi:hypothetical protein
MGARDSALLGNQAADVIGGNHADNIGGFISSRSRP